MSLVAMVATKVALDQAQDQQPINLPPSAGSVTNLISEITRWIPTETVTVYVVLLAMLAPVSGSFPSFTSRWVLFGVMTGANPVVVVLLAMARTKKGAALRLPTFEMIISSVAFAAWAFALPDTPLSSIAGYSLKWNPAILTGTTILIALLASALHRSFDLDQ
jgi:hypothetical protein